MTDAILVAPEGVQKLGRERRYNGTCKACGAKRSTLSRYSNLAAHPWAGHVAGGAVVSEAYVSGRPDLFRTACRCGRKLILREVIGKVSREKECDPRCMAACGFQCECSCGGLNHGGAHG